MLSENRDIQAAKRFFKKAIASPHNQSPRVITVDKNPAYPTEVGIQVFQNCRENNRGIRSHAYDKERAGRMHSFVCPLYS
jgi:IS6 family transposase